jgi:fructose-1-phosphate kinase PfkB-like protein
MGHAAAKTGMTAADVMREVDALIVTRAAEGSLIYTGGGVIEVPCARPRAVVDPTGCGDAYSAGLIHGLLHGLDWEDHRAGRGADGCDQDRVARSAEPQVHTGRIQAVTRQFWRQATKGY